MIAVHDGHTFFGVGKTKTAALKDAREWMTAPFAFVFVPITDELANVIIKFGGDLPYIELQDGTYDATDKYKQLLVKPTSSSDA